MTSYARNYHIILDQVHICVDALEFLESPKTTTTTTTTLDLVRSYTSQTTVHNVRRRRQG